ncbi:penicillin-binding protein [Actibacterium mucosum KCTC 23349]|uniref:Penicillin-binding protein 1A n=1 Tax=Actibacterium mucosum KCTC 23349 TaxID=1454373 RepID=A0A037ZDC5_9RHOB|nr:PBP1A family penicillin-binding protein [Actibacterium mucosum]KAJ54464.1 penicillin-binding protein [Actibacterium mucosum KCTC 23349]
MIRFVANFLGAIFSFATVGTAMGAILIGGVFWAYARGLPNHQELTNYTPKTISRIYSGEGQLIDEFATERRLFAPIEEIPDLVKNAFISAEDKNFYTHQGYDPRGIAAAMFEALRSRGESLRGASTIPQQVAKISFLSSERRIERKVKEIILASRMVNTLGRDKVLEIYLNDIDLGVRSFGVRAAAQSYFNKNLADLEPHEAAFLAVHPKAPYSYRPHNVNEYDRAMDRRNFVLKEMNENGYLSDAEYETARATPIETVQMGKMASFKESLPPRDYFTDEIRRQLSANFGQDEFFGGGLTIRATADPELQSEAALALRDGLEKYDRAQGVWRGTGLKVAETELGTEEAWRKALAAVETPRDIWGWYPAVVLEVGKTHARIGIEDVANDSDGHWIPPEDVKWARKLLEDGELGRKASRASDLLELGDVVYVRQMTKDSDGSFIRWTLRQIPEVQGGFMAMDVNTGRVLAMQGGFSYQHSVFNRATQATRQPGSSFKPLVYATALDSGFTPATIIIDAPIEIDTGADIWRPKNASNKFYGPTPLRTGIERSRNLMTVRLAQEIGMQTVAGYAERFGVYDRLEPFLANSLGAQETTLFKMVSAYAMFANGGERVEPTLVDRVQDRQGRTIYRHDPRDCPDCKLASIDPLFAPQIVSNRERVINAITAYQLTSMMQGVVQRGTAAGKVNLGVPTAGKTGTTNDARDVWFIGFTSNIVAGCYIGYDQPKPLGRGASGGGMCGPVFNQFMTKATEKYGGGSFKVPEGGHFIKIDRFSGARLADDATGDFVVSEYFRDGEEPIFGLGALIDGGFAMGANLPLFSPEELGLDEQATVKTSTGKTITIGPKANFGSLGTGGLY